MREDSNDKSDNFETDIIGEGALYKEMTVPLKKIQNKPGRKFMRSLSMNNLKNQMLSFQMSLYLNTKQITIFLILFLLV